MIKHALYAGSFDPFTNGHLDIVTRGIGLFDKVTILLATSPNKKHLIPLEARKDIITKVFSHQPNVLVDSWDGLLVDYCKEKEINYILRGLRPTGDFEIEFQMASMNKHLFPEVETYFLTTGEDYFYVSSSLVKEVYSHGGNVSNLVPGVVLEYLSQKGRKK